ncbi:MAG: hypothetical protein ACE5I7_18725, partial [Candidatus Binatia bacterium]
MLVTDALAPQVPRASSRQPGGPPEWASWPDEQLLDLRLCDLRVRIRGSSLAAQITQLYRELKERHIGFRPYFWLSDDWF